MGKFTVVKGVERRPHATIITGRSGIGKTFLASTIPTRFFVCVEQGLKGASPDHVAEVERYERPQSYGELLEMIGEFRSFAKANGHRHFVTDSLSGVERLINLKTCQLESVAHMEAKDFKKVWTAAIPLWQRVQTELDRLRDEAGVHLWLIAHSQETSETTEGGDTFSKWDLMFQGSGKSLAELRQLWRAWADHVLFIDWDADVKKSSSIGTKAVGRYKSRILRTRETPYVYAKNRAGLPQIIPATWADLERAMRAGAPASDAKLRGQITALLPQLGEQDRATIEADLGTAKTPTALSAVLSRAQGMISVARQDVDDEPTAAAPATSGAPPSEPAAPEPPPPSVPAPDQPPASPAVDPEAAALDAIEAELRRQIDTLVGAELEAIPEAAKRQLAGDRLERVKAHYKARAKALRAATQPASGAAA